MDNGGIQTNRPKNKKIDDLNKVLHPRDDIKVYMCQEKKEEEDPTALRIM